MNRWKIFLLLGLAFSASAVFIGYSLTSRRPTPASASATTSTVTAVGTSIGDREEAPRINDLASQFEPRGVHVLGIDIKDSQARTEAGIKDFGIQYQVGRDGDAAIARRYKVTGTPTIVFLDRQGIVRYFGNELPRDYAERLEALITQQS